MRVDNISDMNKQRVFDSLDNRLKQFGAPVFIKYLQMGSQIVRLINYSASFTQHVELQLGYILKDDAPSYHCTLVIWQEEDITNIIIPLSFIYNTKLYRELRLSRVTKVAPKVPTDLEELRFFDENIFLDKPFLHADILCQEFSAFNPNTNTYYFSLSNLSTEELMKKGHIFIHTFNKILKTPNTNLGHGAIVGLNDIGVLICGIGYRGKSTLAVSAMLDGFEYVSDDYLILEKHGENLLSWPIYSIITLSPNIYNSMLYDLNAKFVSNNGRKDKYVFNIAEYHAQFKQAYPIRLCMYPRFVEDANPSIELGDKDIATQELILSTLRQMGEAEDVKNIAKKYSFVENLPFYRFNLSNDIKKNTKFLREFIEDFSKK